MAETIIAIGSLVTAIFGGIKIILDYRKNTKKTNEILEKVVNQNEELKEQLNDVKEIGQGNRKGNRNIIRYRVRREMNVAIERGYEYTDHYSEVVELYHTYKELGGNGVVDSLYEKYSQLPLKEK